MCPMPSVYSFPVIDGRCVLALEGAGPDKEHAVELMRNDARAVVTYGVIALAVGLAIAMAYAAQFTRAVALGVGSVVLSLGLAMFAVGAVIGFLLGLPRAVQARQLGRRSPDSAETPGDANASLESLPVYRSNANLEQISDWLVKILIGVGMTQLAVVKGIGTALADWLRPALGNADSSVPFALAMSVYTLVAGFLVGCLLTRLCLAGALRGADIEVLRREEAAIQVTVSAPGSPEADDTRTGQPAEFGELDRRAVAAFDARDLDSRGGRRKARLGLPKPRRAAK